MTNESHQRDPGGVLPMVLVAVVVFTIVVGAVSTLVATGLKYGGVVEERADRLAAADAGLRFGVERLRNFDDELCTTSLGAGGGFTTLFPPRVNDADTTVTCAQAGNPIAGGQGYGLMITGEGVPSGQPHLIVTGASNSDKKKIKGPLYIADVSRVDMTADLIIEQGDLVHTRSTCPQTPITVDTHLKFVPSLYRSPKCITENWKQLFDEPSVDIPTPQALQTPANYDDISFPGCRIFHPGKYSGTIPLATYNYFQSGDYYFENVPFTLTSKTVTMGFPSGSGDGVKVDAPECYDAMIYDQNLSGERGGATVWLGGTSKILIDTGGELEIFRRQQFERYMSVFAVKQNGAGFIPSSLVYGPSPFPYILETKAGNTNDIAIHGWFWAPDSKVKLDNVTNAVIGQLIGGLTVAHLNAQASSSANDFAIGLEGTPIETDFVLEATATKDGSTTTIQAVVQFRPDSRDLAVKSWRVIG